MTTKDKIAMILTSRGFSLAEGMAMYDELMADDKKSLVKVCPEKNVVVWLEGNYGTEKKVHVMIWLNFERNVCHNDALLGHLLLLDIKDEVSKKFIDFFRSCRGIYDCPGFLPVLPDELQWIFSTTYFKDYMEADEYEVDNHTFIKINVEQSINGI